MSLDLRDYDEVVCPECLTPYVVSAVQGEPGIYRIDGCLCPNKDVIELPTGIIFTLESGPMTFFVKRGIDE